MTGVHFSIVEKLYELAMYQTKLTFWWMRGKKEKSATSTKQSENENENDRPSPLDVELGMASESPSDDDALKDSTNDGTTETANKPTLWQRLKCFLRCLMNCPRTLWQCLKCFLRSLWQLLKCFLCCLMNCPSATSYSWFNVVMVLILLCILSFISRLLISFAPLSSVDDGLEANRDFLYGWSIIIDVYINMAYLLIYCFMMEKERPHLLILFIIAVGGVIAPKLVLAIISEGWLSGMKIFPIPFSTVLSATVSLIVVTIGFYFLTPKQVRLVGFGKRLFFTFAAIVMYIISLVLGIVYSELFKILDGSVHQLWTSILSFAFKSLSDLGVIFLSRQANERKWVLMVLLVGMIYADIQVATIPYILLWYSWLTMALNDVVSTFFPLLAGLDRIKLHMRVWWSNVRGNSLLKEILREELCKNDQSRLFTSVILAPVSDFYHAAIRIDEKEKALRKKSNDSTSDLDNENSNKTETEKQDVNEGKTNDGKTVDTMVISSERSHDEKDGKSKSESEESTHVIPSVVVVDEDIESGLSSASIRESSDSSSVSHQESSSDLSVESSPVDNKDIENDDLVHVPLDVEKKENNTEGEVKQEEQVIDNDDHVVAEEGRTADVTCENRSNDEKKNNVDKNGDEDDNEEEKVVDIEKVVVIPSLGDEDEVLELELELELEESLGFSRKGMKLDGDSTEHDGEFVDPLASTTTEMTLDETQTPKEGIENVIEEGGEKEKNKEVWEQRALGDTFSAIGGLLIKTIVLTLNQIMIMMDPYFSTKDHLKDQFAIDEAQRQTAILYGWGLVGFHIVIFLVASYIIRRIYGNRVTLKSVIQFLFHDNFTFMLVALVMSTNFGNVLRLQHLGGK